MKLSETFSGLKPIFRSLGSRTRPILAHLIVTRKCNLSCAYCNEYDKVSPPVDFEELKKRIDKLAELGTGVITLSGGEPLLHPELLGIISHIRRSGMSVTLITNGFLLTEKKILGLNEAGLQEMQISIDNLVPDEISHKSLKTLDKKLQLLAKHANFKININSVLGISDERTQDAIEVAEKAIEYGFSHSVGILHDSAGHLKPLSPKQLETYHRIGKRSKSIVHKFNYRLFQKNLIEGKTNSWKCRAGARYLYISEEGLVHWCSQQRGYPGIPLKDYTEENILAEFDTQKDCAPKCTVACVHQSSMFDAWRGKQKRRDPSRDSKKDESLEAIASSAAR